MAIHAPEMKRQPMTGLAFDSSAILIVVVILSGATASRWEAAAKSKGPYKLFDSGAREELIAQANSHLDDTG